LQEKLEQVSAVLDGLPTTALAAVTADVARSERISAEQILRAIVVQRMTGWGYSELAFELQDSSMLRRFCRLGAGAVLSEAMLQEAIERITPQTIECVTRHLAAHGL
jgi:hypothetical protein